MRPASLAYLYSRYPVVSQTFCDTEMLAMEQLGAPLVVGSLNPPPNSFRHPHLARLQAEVVYPAPPAILKLWEEHARTVGAWPEALIERHEAEFGKPSKPGQRARNALYFAREFKRRGVRHIHVHFTNRAAHTAMYIKALTGIPYSITAHAQDFMVDLGSRELLRAMLLEAQFIIAVSDFSRELLVEICPEAAGRIHRVYNGQDLSAWPAPQIPNPRELAAAEAGKGPLIFSVGRLIEFKGFHILLEACALLREKGVDFRCEIAGEGPWREQLEDQIRDLALGDRVALLGVQDQDQVRAKLAECAVFALGSLVDGKGAMDILPTVILEAMAAGKPVASTRLAGIPEMVLEGENGLLADPGNVEELASALERLLADADLRAKYGAVGRARLERIFSVPQTAPGLYARFTESIDQPPGEPSTLQARWREKIAAINQPVAGAAPFSRLVYWIPAPPENSAELTALLLELAAMRKFCAGEENLRFAVLWGRFPSVLPQLPDRHADVFKQILRESRYAPDALVLEGAWQADRQAALRLEALRQDLSASTPSGDFLEQARLLRGWLAAQLAELPGHWHVHGAAGALSAWLARESGAAPAESHSWSATLPGPSPAWPGSNLRELGDGLSGGRVAHEHLLEKLGGAPKGWLPDRLVIIPADQGVSGMLQSLGVVNREIRLDKEALFQWTRQLRTWTQAHRLP